jgi:hypothetical protein
MAVTVSNRIRIVFKPAIPLVGGAFDMPGARRVIVSYDMGTFIHMNALSV